ncbi:hypothetical protein [Flavobacterium sp.]|jgi:hypothetical protein|uniref:hypothetical protein n=1 Tax=Flavobacterium sp. TaxID=239 RepID=UPI0037BEB5C8
MKTIQEKHCNIQLHEIRSIVELAFPVMQESILHHRYPVLSAMQGNEPEYELMKQNLKFLIRLSSTVFTMYKHKEVYLAFHYFMDLYLNRNFSERKAFYWYELKSVLFMATYFKEVKTYKEFEQKIKQKSFHDTLSKYKRKDAIDRSSIKSTESYYQIHVANKQLVISF